MGVAPGGCSYWGIIVKDHTAPQWPVKEHLKYDWWLPRGYGEVKRVGHKATEDMLAG